MPKGILRNFSRFTGKPHRQSLLFFKETLTQLLYCEFCEISKNVFFIKHLRTTASHYPSKEKLYSSLTNSKISATKYEHVLNIWNKFEMKTMKDYHDLYLKCDY